MNRQTDCFIATPNVKVNNIDFNTKTANYCKSQTYEDYKTSLQAQSSQRTLIAFHDDNAETEGKTAWVSDIDRQT